MSDLHNLSQTKPPENHTHHGSTYPHSIYTGVKPPPHNLGLYWCITGTEEYLSKVDSSVLLIHHDLNDLGSVSSHGTHSKTDQQEHEKKENSNPYTRKLMR